MPQRIGLICDSTADFPKGLEKELGLHILPVHIMVDGQDHLHGQTISNRQVVEALRQKRDVFTKPFFPHECADYFEDLLGKYDRVVSFHLSTALSGNYNSAIAALNRVLSYDAGLGDITYELTAVLVLTAAYFAVGTWIFTRRHMPTVG